MYAVAGKGVEIGGQGGDQGLAFAGLHFRDHAAVENDAAHELDVEMALAQGALGGFADGGEGFHQKIVEGLALVDAFAELVGACPQLVIGKLFQGRFQIVDLRDDGTEFLQVAVVGGTENPPGESAKHSVLQKFPV